MIFKKMIITLLPLLTLAGCAQSYTHDFLVTHPDELQAEIKKCEQNGTNVAYCDMVMETRDEFVDLVNLRSANVEKFGEELLKQQTVLVKMQEDFNNEQANFEMQKKHLDATELKIAKEKLQKVRADYAAQQLKVGKLSAVISATSSPNL